MRRKNEIQELLKEIKGIIRRLGRFEATYSKQLKKVHLGITPAH